MNRGRALPGLFFWTLRRALFACVLVWLTACSPTLDWREVKPPGLGFVVLMPGKPQTVTREVAFGAAPMRMTMVSSGVGPSLFAVGMARLPAEALAPDRLDATLEWFRDGLARNIGGRVTRAAPAKLPAAAAAGQAVRGGLAVEANGRVGRDGRPGRLAARFHVVDDRLFQLVAIGAEGEITDDALETFFSSFRLIP